MSRHYDPQHPELPFFSPTQLETLRNSATIKAEPPPGEVERAIAIVKSYLKGNCDKGMHCPTCGTLYKRYQRTLNASLAAALILIYRYYKHADPHDWLHVSNYLAKHATTGKWSGGDVAKLVHWGLLQRMEGKRDDGSPRVGFYRMTDVGRRFVRGEITVPRKVYLEKGRFAGASDQDRITIRQALGTKFNYAELMEETRHAG